MSRPEQTGPGGAFLNRIGTAHPPHDVHRAFIAWAARQLDDSRERTVFERMASRAGINHRWSVLGGPSFAQGDGLAFYGPDATMPTGRRMEVYARNAPDLAREAIEALGALDGITHIVVASCTGFVAPGIDQILIRQLALPDSVERVLIGFMGCYAAITALRTARHIVRSEPDARVLVVTVELCTLHLQDDTQVDRLLAMLQFGDGAAAAIVSAEPHGLELTDPFAIALPESRELITWHIGDQGFVMNLSGEVPQRLVSALEDPAVRKRVTAARPVDDWAVHAGGRSILDAVTRGLDLPPDALDHSRAVLEDFGNMSSATLMFVLARVLREEKSVANGRAIAFGPGLAAEGLGYRSVR